MKRVLMAFCLLLLTSTFVSHAYAKEDISGHWANVQLTYAKDHGILKGDNYGNLNPDKSITRAEFAAILVRSLKLEEATILNEAKTFNDVVDTAWYADVVTLASQFGLITGDDLGNFNPNALIARQDMATMLRRALDYKGMETFPLLLTFADKATISSYAYENVQRVVSLKVMNGADGNKFKPKANATRAEASTVMYNFLQLPEDAEPIKIGREITYKNYDTDYGTVLAKQVAVTKADNLGNFGASTELVNYYLHPATFDKTSYAFYQFLRLDKPITGLTAEMLNTTVLKNAGVLSGLGDLFIESAKANNTNEVYLVSHALHETAKGVSPLAKGIEVGLDATGKATMVTTENRDSLTEIKKTYNMFGVKANDGVAEKNGSEYAYTQKWFTVKDAIIGGAKFIGNGYISATPPQNTLYKMKWNPDKYGEHEYATHMVWATVQAKTISDLFTTSGLDQKILLEFEVPVYKNQPITLPTLPAQQNWYALSTKNAGKTGVITVSNTTIYSYPVASSAEKLGTLAVNTPFTIIGQNGDKTVWYKVKTATGITGWVNAAYAKRDDEITIPTTPTTPTTPESGTTTPGTESGSTTPTDPSTSGSTGTGSTVVGKTGVTTVNDLKFRTEPATTYKILTTLSKDVSFTILEEKNGWYKATINGVTGWMSGAYVTVK